MNNLQDFVDRARSKGLPDEDIRHRLEEAGWLEADINGALDDLTPPKPVNDLVVPQPEGTVARPLAVVHNLSVRGFEYSIMFIALWLSAFAMGALAQRFLNNAFDKASGNYTYGQVDAFNSLMITFLLVCFPIFAFLFVRLKKAELNNATLFKDPSRRRWSQLTQLVAFLVGLGYIIYFVYTLITPDQSGNGPSVGQQFLRMLITLVIAGGIFLYYWREDHRHPDEN